MTALDTQTKITYPPGGLYSDEPPLESDLHLRQIILLLTCLDWLWQDRHDYFASGNLTIYYSERRQKTEDFRGPDFFVVLDTEKRSRKSWVVWEEDYKYPNLILEILSDSTAHIDRNVKKNIYQNTFQTPEYFWFDPETLEFQGFNLIEGEYQPLEPNESGWLWSQQLGLYLGTFESKLRFFKPDGELVPTPQEAAIQAEARAESERQQVEYERQQKELAQQQLASLTAQLKALGIEPNS